MIVLQDVTKLYDGVAAVQDVSVAVARGEFAFLIGSNGAGKTTLIKLIIREERPDAGVVLVGGVDVARLSGVGLTKLRRRIGVVFQDTRLLPNATVAENVALPMQVRGHGGQELTTAVKTVLGRVGLEGFDVRYPRQLSGGEQRKAAIARAIVAHPEFLLCDEPTDSLSPPIAREIVELLLSINSDGVTTIVATHDRDIVNSLRRRVIHMDSGHIHADTAVGQFNVI